MVNDNTTTANNNTNNNGGLELKIGNINRTTVVSTANEITDDVINQTNVAESTNGISDIVDNSEKANVCQDISFHSNSDTIKRKKKELPRRIKRNSDQFELLSVKFIHENMPSDSNINKPAIQGKYSPITVTNCNDSKNNC